MSLLIQSHHHHHHYAMDQPSHNTAPFYNTHSESTQNKTQPPAFDYTQRPDAFPPPPSVAVSTTNPHAIAIDLTSPQPYPSPTTTTAANNEAHSPIPLPAAPTHSSSAVPPPTQPTLCPICTTHIHPAHLADHLHLERKQLAGEPLTPSDRLALQQHGVQLAAPTPAAATRTARRSNASSLGAPAKSKAKAAASASVSSTLGQYKLLVEGVATRRRTRAAAMAAAEAGSTGCATPARGSLSRNAFSSLVTSLAPPSSSSRARRPPPPPAPPSRKRQAWRASASSAAMLIDPSSDDWSPAASAGLGSVVCPICAQFVVGDELAVNAHIDACLANPLLGRAAAAATTADGVVSVDSGESGSEREEADAASTDDDPAMYEPLPVAPPRPLPRAPAATSAPPWAPASVAHSPPSRSMSAAGADTDSDDDELDVDIDADPSADRTATYGTAQFTELDVLPYSVAIHGANDLALQSLVAATPGREDAEAVHKRILDQAAAVAKRVQCQLPAPPAAATGMGMSAAERAEAVTLEALKERVAHLERLTQETPRCKVCWEGLGGKVGGAPVVSVACWHVHCQECWLQSLGYRKVCPQCLVITRPEDLRKVYI